MFSDANEPRGHKSESYAFSGSILILKMVMSVLIQVRIKFGNLKSKVEKPRVQDSDIPY